MTGSRGKTEDSELTRQWFWAGFPRSLEWREVSLDRAGPDDILLNTGKARTQVQGAWCGGWGSPQVASRRCGCAEWVLWLKALEREEDTV